MNGTQLGPWFAHHSTLIVDENGDPIADLFVVRDSIEQGARARLIAAAPKLLEAALVLLDHGDPDLASNHSAQSYADAWEALEKAVMEVAGEER